MKINKLFILVALLVFVACAPYPVDTPQTYAPQPTAQAMDIYNANPELSQHGGCKQQWFDIPGDAFGPQYYWQCWPEQYEVYQASCNPARVEVTDNGGLYQMVIGGRCGEIGYQFTATLPNTCVAIEVTGSFHGWPKLHNLSLRSHISVLGGEGKVQLHDITVYNGPFRKSFYVRVNQHDTYQIAVYFNQWFLDSTDMYSWFDSIKTYAVPDGYCTDAPGL